MNKKRYYGNWGGSYIPEVLHQTFQELALVRGIDDSYYYDDYGYYGDYAYYDYDFDDFYVEDYYTSTANAIEPSGLLVDIKKTGLSDRDWFKIISYADNYFQGELYPLNAPAEFWDEIGFNGNL